MNEPQLYIDPHCRLSKVPYEVPNNTHYVTLSDYNSLKADLNAVLRDRALMFQSLKETQAAYERLNYHYLLLRDADVDNRNRGGYNPPL